MSKVKVSLSKEQKHLVFSVKSYDDLGLEIKDKTQRAILEINPELKASVVLANAKAIEWAIIGQADNAGFFDVVRASELQGVETSEEQEVEQDA